MPMSNKELFTIAEYAAAKGITKQAVYKQLNNKLKPFVVEVDGKKHISVAAFGDEEPKIEQPVEQHKFNVEQLVEQQVDFLQNQICEKDKQIENLLRQIDNLQNQNTSLTELLRNSQVLLATEQKMLIGQAESQERADPVEEVKQPVEQVQEPKKKGFFKWLFGNQ